MEARASKLVQPDNCKRVFVINNKKVNKSISSLRNIFSQGIIGEFEDLFFKCVGWMEFRVSARNLPPSSQWARNRQEGVEWWIPASRQTRRHNPSGQIFSCAHIILFGNLHLQKFRML